MPENDPDRSARTPLEMLRGVTRRVATAESLEVVLQSIAAALVEQADAANTRIFLALTDADCPVCQSTGTGEPGPAPVRAGPALRAPVPVVRTRKEFLTVFPWIPRCRPRSNGACASRS